MLILPVFIPLLQCLSCACPYPPSTVVTGGGGEDVPSGRDVLSEGEAEPLRLFGRLRHCHHWQEAAAAAESNGAASGGELQVQHVHTHTVGFT